MLAITEEAVSAINTILDSSALPDGSGVRIATVPARENAGGPELQLHLSLAREPEEGDEVLGEEAVFLEPAAAAALDNKVLDAEIVEEQVRFVVAEQG